MGEMRIVDRFSLDHLIARIAGNHAGTRLALVRTGGRVRPDPTVARCLLPRPFSCPAHGRSEAHHVPAHIGEVIPQAEMG